MSTLTVLFEMEMVAGEAICSESMVLEGLRGENGVD